jgi:hypothetical protein
MATNKAAKPIMGPNTPAYRGKMANDFSVASPVYEKTADRQYLGGDR